ncbi:unnamed protein product [Trichobilharzia regenti]|nr:unnamed protein product [Trichobilharzia regenti]
MYQCSTIKLIISLCKLINFLFSTYFYSRFYSLCYGFLHLENLTHQSALSDNFIGGISSYRSSLMNTDVLRNECNTVNSNIAYQNKIIYEHLLNGIKKSTIENEQKNYISNGLIESKRVKQVKTLQLHFCDLVSFYNQLQNNVTINKEKDLVLNTNCSFNQVR